jgi:hypothetical protein
VTCKLISIIKDDDVIGRDDQNKDNEDTQQNTQDKETLQTPKKYVEERKEGSTTQGTEHTHSTIITTVTSIDTTPITSIPSRLISTTFDLDNFQPIQEIILPLNTYVFSDTTKTIVKRRNKKRKIGKPEETS